MYDPDSRELSRVERSTKSRTSSRMPRSLQLPKDMLEEANAEDEESVSETETEAEDENEKR